MTEGKRAIIFVGVLLNILLINQSVTSNLQVDPGVNDYRIVSRTYERFGHPNSSISNQRELERHHSDLSRSRREPSRRILNAPYLPARFSFTGRSEEYFQFERQRRIFREPQNNRQERSRVIMNDSPLPEHIQRRSVKMDFDNSRYFRHSEAPSDRSIRRETFSQPKIRFLNSESVVPVSNNRVRRIDSRIRGSRNTEFFHHRTREFERNRDLSENRRTRSTRTLEAGRDENLNRVLSKNAKTSNLARSLFESTLSHYFPHNLIPSLELYQINDFVVSTIAGILLFDMMGAMTQNKAVAANKKSFGNFVEKMAFAVQKMVAH